jgi:hypothetical protein
MKKSDRKLLDRAKKRFQKASERDSKQINERNDDLRFVRLGEQWAPEVKEARNAPGQERPMLVINRLFQFRNQIINEIRQNRPAIKFRPSDAGEEKAAELREDLIRAIQHETRMDIATDTAAELQVDTGLGYFRIYTEYSDPESFNEKVVVKRITDSSLVYCSPYEEPDGSDMKWCFILKKLTKEDFEAEYPKAKPENWESAGNGWSGMDTEDERLIAEYFELEEEKKTLVMLDDGSIVWKDDLPEKFYPRIIQERRSSKNTCNWYKLAGDQVLEEAEQLTSYIPVVPVLGSEVWLEGERHLHGLTRHAKDPQRVYNYMESANAELLALAPRAPFIAGEGQLDNHPEWARANKINYAYLTYSPLTTTGQILGAPQRAQGPSTNPGFESAMARAVDDIKATMGIFDASLGNHEANQSGRAIQSQQAQASVGNFHFSDNLSRSVAHAGVIINEMLTVYNIRGPLKGLKPDGSSKEYMIEPNQKEAYVLHPDGTETYNIDAGKFTVSVDTGPSYNTKRQEAVGGMMALAQAFPPILQTAGDIIVRNMDWPGSEEIADRLAKALPPQLQDKQEGAPQVDPQLEQQMNQMADMVQHLSQELQAAQKVIADKAHSANLEWFKAYTDRIRVDGDLSLKATMSEAELHTIALANLQATINMVPPDEDQEQNGQAPQGQTTENSTPGNSQTPESPQSYPDVMSQQSPEAQQWNQQKQTPNPTPNQTPMP